MARQRNRIYTVMIVPDRTAAVKRYRVPRSLVRLVLGTVFVFALVISGAALHYYRVVGEATQAQVLRDENMDLRAELRTVQEKVAHIAASLDRVERLDAKLRMITQLNDPERNLAIGPVGTEAHNSVTGTVDEGDQDSGGSDPGLDIPGLALGTPSGKADIELLHTRLENLGDEARREESSLRELQEYFQDQRTLLGAMPSIWPARGWVTSAFGIRVDPFTSDRHMHEGLDIAAGIGTTVHAPAHGTVVFAGLHGAYGNVIVIDHGYGVNTRYGHLSEIFVQVGDKVTRGQKIGAIGNTGRSTGPHLHYEVRVNGIPEDPRKFILD